MSISASSLAKRLGWRWLGEDFIINGVSIDTRTLERGDVFVALQGTRGRGEEYLAQAEALGAVGAIVAESNSAISLPQILVPDPVQALHILGEMKRFASDAKFIGITGSNGKTSTKEMLAFVLAKAGKTHSTRGNLNNHLGVPLTLANLRGDEEYVVVEMGANHLGEIEPLANLVRPHFGLITSIAPAHLEGFGNLEGVINTKEALLAAAEKIVLNLNLPVEALHRWQERYGHKVVKTYGRSPAADIYLQTAGASEFVASDHRRTIAVNWQCLGAHNQLNGLATIAMVEALGLDGKLCEALRDFEMVAGRFQRRRYGIHWVIDDSYNANAASFTEALRTLASLKDFHGRVYAGAMGELGADSERQHHQVAALAAELNLEFQPVATEAYGLRSISKEQAREELKQRLKLKEPQALLIKGSRSACLETLLTDLGQPFN